MGYVETLGRSCHSLRLEARKSKCLEIIPLETFCVSRFLFFAGEIAKCFNEIWNHCSRFQGKCFRVRVSGLGFQGQNFRARVFVFVNHHENPDSKFLKN